MKKRCGKIGEERTRADERGGGKGMNGYIFPPFSYRVRGELTGRRVAF
jgi:hypothetical protein